MLDIEFLLYPLIEAMKDLQWSEDDIESVKKSVMSVSVKEGLSILRRRHFATVLRCAISQGPLNVFDTRRLIELAPSFMLGFAKYVLGDTGSLPKLMNRVYKGGIQSDQLLHYLIYLNNGE